MKKKGIATLLWIVAGSGLILTILPPILVFANSISFGLHLTLMTVGMILWFGARIAIQTLSADEETDG